MLHQCGKDTSLLFTLGQSILSIDGKRYDLELQIKHVPYEDTTEDELTFDIENNSRRRLAAQGTSAN